MYNSCGFIDNVSGEYALTRRDMKTWTLIRDLEEAVFNLKEHLLSVDAGSHSSRTDQTDTDTDVVGKQLRPQQRSSAVAEKPRDASSILNRGYVWNKTLK